jgi:cysteine synthase A
VTIRIDFSDNPPKERIMNIDSLIGNTPLVKISDKIYAKLETYNPSGSIKDRMASYILKKAEENGDLRPGYTIVEASSGNTGIAFSMLAANKGYACIVVMPENMSEERKQMMKLYGARIIEVGHNAFKEAIRVRNELVANFGTYWSPKQFNNKYNIECHRRTTAREIFDQTPEEISALISGSGTGGTIMGCHNFLSEKFPNMKTVLVKPLEPAETHGIQGINDGADFLCNMSKIDNVIEISTSEAKFRQARLAKETGLLVGFSAGANILAAENWVKNNNPSGIVVTFLCDRGERYLSCV